MTVNGSIRPDVDQVLAGLKDFQRDTVAYVFRRLYTDPDPVSRFLIADEVGLGKTLVARGVIAEAVNYLWHTVERIDVIYICSNQDIARQNINRLNITLEREFQHASRATLLPVVLHELRGNKLNFVSLTPGTSFDLKSRGGRWQERALLYWMLKDQWDVREGPLRNVLRGGVLKENWPGYLRRFREAEYQEIDEELRQAFLIQLDERRDLRVEYDYLASWIGSRRKHLTEEMRRRRNEFVGQLRRLLARSSLDALEPDLVILDEFQRFRSLFDEETAAGLLAQTLFEFEDVKMLLLSATPYKMYTLAGEEGEDHYDDFHATVNFLLEDDPLASADLKRAIERYRDRLLHLEHLGIERLREAKEAVEQILRRVMVRTERLAASPDRNGMLSEQVEGKHRIKAADVLRFVHLDQLAQALEAGDQVEYWKSAPYPLNFMPDYVLKKRLKDALEASVSTDLRAVLEEAEVHLLHWDDVETYQPLDPANARMRVLWDLAVETGNWQLLWLPPSLPYYQPRPDSPYRHVSSKGATKSLIFSAWRLVPKTIAMLLSYEAERRMVESAELDFIYSELTERRRPLLNFTYSEGRLTGMPVFTLIYPCLTLARKVDPLRVVHDLVDPEDRLPSADVVFSVMRERVGEILEHILPPPDEGEEGRSDERWYWAALALLDHHYYHDTVERWFQQEDEQLVWGRMLLGDDTEDGGRFGDHVQAFQDAFYGVMNDELGRRPDDLVDVLTCIALAAPGVTSLRALVRVRHLEDDADWTGFLAAAACIALGFRSLFNRPENIALLQRWYEGRPYWEKTLWYALDGNLQAVMDEYLHILYESLGLMEHEPADCAQQMCEVVEDALTLRAATLSFDEISVESDVQMESRGMRCRYALRFDPKDTSVGAGMRSTDVRMAFNSPFRPFVLATTSIGQEGLDFHQYCHRVIHWNLPSNPVDLEQREGRVHRYKGHVIRRNLALHYGLAGAENGKALSDPWQTLFERAVADRDDPGVGDLVPYWIFEPGPGVGDGYKVERIIPTLPLSRELGRLERLKRSLVIYRSVIGQPRQEELVDFLTLHLLDEDNREHFGEEFAIDLSPPKRSRHS